jgi:hypothetical protein
MSKVSTTRRVPRRRRRVMEAEILQTLIEIEYWLGMVFLALCGLLGIKIAEVTMK